MTTTIECIAAHTRSTVYYSTICSEYCDLTSAYYVHFIFRYKANLECLAPLTYKQMQCCYLHLTVENFLPHHRLL